ncbi:hypothetical protein IPC346_14815 [Pseudomonas aeruginosa]|nr:hypothetical protein IPC346_14815 [Pseudomonas aeruginosa]
MSKSPASGALRHDPGVGRATAGLLYLTCSPVCSPPPEAPPSFLSGMANGWHSTSAGRDERRRTPRTRRPGLDPWGHRRISRGRSKNFRPAVRRPTPYDKPGAHVIIPRPFTAGSGRLDSQPALAGPRFRPAWSLSGPLFLDSGPPVTKDELRAALAREEQRYKDVYGGEVTLYAAQPEPDRKPWRKRPTVQEQAFDRELQKIEEERLKAGQEAANPIPFTSNRQESDG